MNDDQVEELKHQLDAIIVLLAMQLPEEKSGKNLVIALDKAGLSAKDIARVLGLTVNNIRVTLHRAKKDHK